MISFINRNNHKAWKKLPISRQEMPDYPERAITEACVNALIHRDYLEYGSEVHVDIFDDRLEIYSPGGMVDGSRVQDLDPLKITSKRRNPVIADIFSRLNLMERRGSGFKKIMEDYRAYSATAGQMPKFSSDTYHFFIILPNLNYGQNGVEYLEEVNSIGNVTKDVTKDVTKRRDAIIAMMTFNNAITIDEIADRLHVNRRTILRDIDYLRERNRIERTGGRKEGYWKIKLKK
jgi:predicted HTH transcriptional regulator